MRLYSEENVNHLFLSQIKGNTVVKNPPTNARESCGSLNAGDAASIPGLGRPPGVGNGNPIQYSCLQNSMDRGALWATVHGVAKSWT